jgi:hypothetical protein
MNTPFGVHILGCDACEGAVSELIRHNEICLERNIGRLESTSPYLPLPTEENTARAWPMAQVGHP